MSNSKFFVKYCKILVGQKRLKIDKYTMVRGGLEPIWHETFYISRKHYFSKWIFESEAGIGYQIGDTFDWFKIPKSSQEFKPVRSGGDYTHYAKVEAI